MAALDSTIVFKERVQELSLGHLWGRFEELRWASNGTFAFVSTPGADGKLSPEDLKRDLLTPLLGAEAVAGDVMPPEAPFLRRLFFEANGMVTQEARTKYDRTDADPPRRLPAAEREERLGRLSARLVGVTITGNLEPANFVVDRFTSMVEDQRIDHVNWASIATRKTELKATPGRKRWMPDAAGHIKEIELREPPSTDVHTHYDASQALQRRSVAVALAGLMSYEVHEQLRDVLMRALTEPPADKRFEAPSMQRIQEVDEWVWEQLSKRCSRRVKPRTQADPHPVDVAMRDVLASPEFHLKLIPFPNFGGGGGGRRDSPRRGANGRRSRTPARGKTLAQRNAAKKESKDDEIARLRRQLADARGGGRGDGRGDGPPGTWGVNRGENRGKGPSGGGRPGGSGSGNKGGGKGSSMGGVPRELYPGVGRTKEGEPICFAYNIDGCNGAKAGDRCNRGLHVCTKFGCQGAHPAFECRGRR